MPLDGNHEHTCPFQIWLSLVHERCHTGGPRAEGVRDLWLHAIKIHGSIGGQKEHALSEKISRRILSGDQGMLVWWSIGAGVHVEPHSHANEQIAWMLKGKMEFRLGGEQRVCGPGDVVVIPGGMEHEAWFREDTQVIDFFAPPRDDFLVGGKPAYISES
jgi:quercetin dioxygenase-like cupin family protein